MLFTPFLKWMWTDLAGIRRVYDFNSDAQPIMFMGWKGSYALFEIKRNDLPDGTAFNKILLAHEGDWLNQEGMSCHTEYRRYEDVQEDLGRGLIFKRKGLSKINRRSLFLFEIDKTATEHILAVPATGEEIDFEIYGVDSKGSLILLIKQEL